MIPLVKRPPKLLPQKLARSPAVALTAPRPQERQALRRPPIPPPLLQRQARRLFEGRRRHLHQAPLGVKVQGAG